MKNIVTLSIERYTNLVAQNLELKRKEKGAINLILRLNESKNLQFFSLDACLDLLSNTSGIENAEQILKSGLVTKKEMKRYIQKRWYEVRKKEY